MLIVLIVFFASSSLPSAIIAHSFPLAHSSALSLSSLSSDASSDKDKENAYNAAAANEAGQLPRSSSDGLAQAGGYNEHHTQRKDGIDAHEKRSSAFSSTDGSVSARRSKLKLPRVAISALLTANSKRGENLERAIDGLAVLRRSIQEVTPVSIFKQLSFVPILAGSVRSSDKWEHVLAQIGWGGNIKRYEKAPLDPTQIRNPQIAKEIITDGAIGIDELLKLNVFDWGDEFDIVVLVDCDVMFHKPFPELISRITGKALRWTKGGWAIERINGGFLVIEPKGDTGKRHRREMLDIILEGDFRPGTGWRGSGIGWTYGGRTIQGILPYYFLHRDQPLKPVGDRSDNASSSLFFHHPADDQQQIDRCRYNNMDQLPECKALEVSKVTSNHFTGDCVKPWYCNARRSPRCELWARRWRLLLVKEMIQQGVLPNGFSTPADLYRMETNCEAMATASLAKELQRKLLS